MARFATSLLFLLAASSLVANDKPLPKLPTTGLVLPAVSRGGRSPIIIDALEAQRLAGLPAEVKEGDEVKLPDGSVRKWAKVEATQDGTYRSRALRGGYLRLEVESAEDRVMILRASGHTYAAINGEPRTGDPYGTGWLLTPVLMKKGKNELLFQCRGDSFKPELTVPPAEIFLTDVDMTLPELTTNLEELSRVDKKKWVGVRAINASQESRSGLWIRGRISKRYYITVPVPTLPPMSQVKLAFPFGLEEADVKNTQACKMTIEILDAKDELVGISSLNVEIAIRKVNEKHRRTFQSQIDGSVQYYSVVPAQPKADGLGLTLTLHGAGVEASGQAACFKSKPWTHVVAATNRRPFGFDWEDWGRLDALEVLADAEDYLKTDPRRRWLTGHSMGGHGTWHLGVTYPDKFAAIGPIAGWVSMFTYAGMRRPEDSDPITGILRRSTNASDTFALANNLKSTGVYILHGDKDDNVPVSQARMMRDVLSKFHPNWVYREQPGAGHWWGDACVDWAPMFQFFEHHTIPERKDVRRVEFATASPGVSSQCYWATIHSQVKPWELSTITIDHDPARGTFRGKTTNVVRLALDVSHLPADKPLHIELDGVSLKDLAHPKDGMLWLAFEDKKWVVGQRPTPAHKGPHRNGSFKDAFRNRMMLVYGTTGTPEENAWALAKARFDAETFYYRGNGAPEIMSDTAFLAAETKDRNIILYGHAESNAAWKPLLGDSPVQVRRGMLKAGECELKADDLGCLFVRPRPGSDIATVAAITGTSIKGLRTTTRIPIFVSGVGIPDLMIIDSTTLTVGNKGIVAAGYFGNDWSIERGDIAWR